MYKKVLVLTPRVYGDCDRAECNDIEVEQMTVRELIVSEAKHGDASTIVDAICEVIDSPDGKWFRQCMSRNGLASLEELRKRHATKKLGAAFMVLRSGKYNFLTPTTITSLNDMAIHELAKEKDAKLFQEVEPKSVMSPPERRTYNQYLREAKAENDRLASANKKRQETKRKKQLAKARKILEEEQTKDKRRKKRTQKA